MVTIIKKHEGIKAPGSSRAGRQCCEAIKPSCTAIQCCGGAAADYGSKSDSWHTAAGLVEWMQTQTLTNQQDKAKEVVEEACIVDTLVWGAGILDSVGSGVGMPYAHRDHPGGVGVSPMTCDRHKPHQPHMQAPSQVSASKRNNMGPHTSHAHAPALWQGRARLHTASKQHSFMITIKAPTV